MAFNDLTAEQQATLSEYVRLLRAWCGVAGYGPGDGRLRAGRGDDAHQGGDRVSHGDVPGRADQLQHRRPAAGMGESGGAEQPHRLGG